MEFRRFTPGSSDYKHALILRQNILRAPLGLDIKDEDLSSEDDQLHFGLFEDDYILACVIAVPLENGKVKIRQMAVSEELQGTGLGSKLFRYCLEELKERGFKKVELNARKTAVSFYEKHGFQIEGEEFTEVSIPHFKMTCSLW